MNDADQPRKILIIGCAAALGREIAQRVIAEARLQGIEVVDHLPVDVVQKDVVLDLNGAVKRLREERVDLEEIAQAVRAQPAPVLVQERYELHPLDGKSKYDRRRKWWHR